MEVDDEAGFRVVSEKLEGGGLGNVRDEARVLREEGATVGGVEPERKDMPGEDALAVGGIDVEGCDLVFCGSWSVRDAEFVCIDGYGEEG